MVRIKCKVFFLIPKGFKFSQAYFKLFHISNELSVESFAIVDPEVLGKKKETDRTILSFTEFRMLSSH